MGTEPITRAIQIRELPVIQSIENKLTQELAASVLKLDIRWTQHRPRPALSREKILVDQG